jgi:hypothetical protein
MRVFCALTPHYARFFSATHWFECEWYFYGIREQFLFRSVARLVESEGYKTISIVNPFKCSGAVHIICFKHLKTLHLSHEVCLQFSYLFFVISYFRKQHLNGDDIYIFCEGGTEFLNIVYMDYRFQKVNAKLIVVSLDKNKTCFK